MLLNLLGAALIHCTLNQPIDHEHNLYKRSMPNRKYYSHEIRTTRNHVRYPFNRSIMNADLMSFVCICIL